MRTLRGANPPSSPRWDSIHLGPWKKEASDILKVHVSHIMLPPVSVFLYQRSRNYIAHPINHNIVGVRNGCCTSLTGLTLRFYVSQGKEVGEIKESVAYIIGNVNIPYRKGNKEKQHSGYIIAPPWLPYYVLKEKEQCKDCYHLSFYSHKPERMKPYSSCLRYRPLKYTRYISNRKVFAHLADLVWALELSLEQW